MDVRFRSVRAAAILAIAVCHGSAQARFGTITVPAQNLMDLEEGTIEAWGRFDFEPAHSSDLRWRGAAQQPGRARMDCLCAVNTVSEQPFAPRRRADLTAPPKKGTAR